MLTKKEQQEQIEQQEKDNSIKLLNNKRMKDKKDSNEKKVCLYEKNGPEEILQEEKVFKSLQSLSSYLSNLKNPYAIMANKIIELNKKEDQYRFFYDEGSYKIYQKEDIQKYFKTTIFTMEYMKLQKMEVFK